MKNLIKRIGKSSGILVILISTMFILLSHGTFSMHTDILFVENDQLKLITKQGTIADLGKYKGEVNTDQLQETDKVYYSISELPFSIKEGNELYQAIKSPYENKWVYLETEFKGDGFEYSLIINDVKNGMQSLVFDQESSPLNGYALAPFAWGSQKNKIFLEAKLIDGVTEHEGIYEFNLSTKELRQIKINPNYFSTPVLNAEKNILAYSVTLGMERNLVEGFANNIALFDLTLGKEKIIVSSGDAHYRIAGFPKASFDKSNLILEKNNQGFHSDQRVLQLNLKLPYSNGTTYCVSKEGRNQPTLPNCGAICTNTYGSPYQHDNTKAIDFDSPNNILDYVRAAAGGTVVFAQNYCNGNQLGNYVAIRHTDNTYAFYGHLDAVYVCVNSVVQQGAIIGDGGNTEVPGYNSSCNTPTTTGDHIHFDYRTGMSSATSANPIFSEYNCVPLINRSYTSQNASPSLSVCTTNDQSCSPMLLNIPTTCSYTSASNFASTLSSNVPNPSCGYSSSIKDVWFRFTVPSSGQYTIQVFPITLTNVGMAIYQGGCSSLTQIAVKCTTAVNTIAKINGTSTAGYWLYVRVWGVGGTTGTFNICARNGIYRLEGEEESTVTDAILSIHPNPTSGVFQIEYHDEPIIDGNIQVFNSLGQIIYNKELKNTDRQFSREIILNHKQNGIYTVRFNTGSKTINKRLLVVN